MKIIESEHYTATAYPLHPTVWEVTLTASGERLEPIIFAGEREVERRLRVMETAFRGTQERQGELF